MKALTKAPMSLGERFRAAREQRGLTLSDVAEQIRIRSVYLAAIEDENWSTIGAPVYTKGFLRTYARFLGLDPEEAVGEFNQAAAQAAPQASGPSYAGGRQTGGRSMAALLWVAGAVAIALIAFVVYLFVAPNHAKSGGAIALATAPAVSDASASPLPTVLPSATPSVQTLAIHLTAPSWLRVVVDGNVSIEGTFPAGTTKTFHGKSAVVRVGNAGGVHIVVDGKPVGPLGASGDVVQRAFAM